VSYLLDTNACIALINGDDSAVHRKFEKARRHGEQVHVSSIVVFELWYGVARVLAPNSIPGVFRHFFPVQ